MDVVIRCSKSKDRLFLVSFCLSCPDLLVLVVVAHAINVQRAECVKIESICITDSLLCQKAHLNLFHSVHLVLWN